MNTPIVGSKSDYLRNIDEINDCLLDLEEMSMFLTPEHRKRLKKLIVNEADNTMFGVDEVEAQFIMVKNIRDRLVSSDGHLLEEADVKQISALVSASNSLISLYFRNQGLIDHLKEVAVLREAVTVAIRGLDKEDQMKFFTTFDKITGGSRD